MTRFHRPSHSLWTDYHVIWIKNRSTLSPPFNQQSMNIVYLKHKFMNLRFSESYISCRLNYIYHNCIHRGCQKGFWEYTLQIHLHQWLHNGLIIHKQKAICCSKAIISLVHEAKTKFKAWKCLLNSLHWLPVQAIIDYELWTMHMHICLFPWLICQLYVQPTLTVFSA